MKHLRKTAINKQESLMTVAAKRTTEAWNTKWFEFLDNYDNELKRL